MGALRLYPDATWTSARATLEATLHAEGAAEADGGAIGPTSGARLGVAVQACTAGGEGGGESRTWKQSCCPFPRSPLTPNSCINIQSILFCALLHFFLSPISSYRVSVILYMYRNLNINKKFYYYSYICDSRHQDQCIKSADPIF